MNKFLAWIAVAGAACALAACNSGNSNSTPGPCGTPPGVAQTVLVYPAPGATGVPDSIGNIIVGSTSAIPNTWGLTVINALAQGGNGAAFISAPTPFPTPNQTPGFANPVYQSSSVAGLVTAGSTIAVFFNNLGSNCLPSTQIGTFTTQ